MDTRKIQKIMIWVIIISDTLFCFLCKSIFNSIIALIVIAMIASIIYLAWHGYKIDEAGIQKKTERGSYCVKDSKATDANCVAHNKEQLKSIYKHWLIMLAVYKHHAVRK